VVLREGATPSDALATELMQHCKAALASYKFPRKIHFVTELPKTATGKIQRFRLRQLQDEPAATSGGPR
jgi:benzoate-CoA ligase